MTTTWEDLANGPRWHGVVAFIRNWAGPFNSDNGMAPEELDSILRAKSLNLPAAVREWYVLAARWRQGGANVWLGPDELEVDDGTIGILTDDNGVNLWGIRVADLEIEDPPVFHLDPPSIYLEWPAFTSCVAAMIINDLIFSGQSDPEDLNPDSAWAELTSRVAAGLNDIYADAPLESATVVIYVYSSRGPLCARARTPAGQALLERLMHPA